MNHGRVSIDEERAECGERNEAEVWVCCRGGEDKTPGRETLF